SCRDDSKRVAAVAFVGHRANVAGVELQHVSRLLPRGLWKAQRLTVKEVLPGLVFATGQLSADLANLGLDRRTPRCSIDRQDVLQELGSPLVGDYACPARLKVQQFGVGPFCPD